MQGKQLYAFACVCVRTCVCVHLCFCAFVCSVCLRSKVSTISFHQYLPGTSLTRRRALICSVYSVDDDGLLDDGIDNNSGDAAAYDDFNQKTVIPSHEHNMILCSQIRRQKAENAQLYAFMSSTMGSGWDAVQQLLRAFMQHYSTNDTPSTSLNSWRQFASDVIRQSPLRNDVPVATLDGIFARATGELVDRRAGLGSRALNDEQFEFAVNQLSALAMDVATSKSRTVHAGSPMEWIMHHVLLDLAARLGHSLVFRDALDKSIDRVKRSGPIQEEMRRNDRAFSSVIRFYRTAKTGKKSRTGYARVLEFAKDFSIVPDKVDQKKLGQIFDSVATKESGDDEPTVGKLQFKEFLLRVSLDAEDTGMASRSGRKKVKINAAMATACFRALLRFIEKSAGFQTMKHKGFAGKTVTFEVGVR